jgi:hypothetical protein
MVDLAQDGRACSIIKSLPAPIIRRSVMQTFKIVRKQDGWAIEVGFAATVVCSSCAAALAQAEAMAEAIRRHGELVSIVVEPSDSPANDSEPVYFAPSPKAAVAARIRSPRRVSRVQ